MNMKYWMELEPLPPWAIRKSDGYYMIVGTQLMTRDDRRLGNAYIDSIEYHKYNLTPYTHDMIVARVITDIGSIMYMTLSELRNHFHKPKYILDIHKARRVRGIIPERDL